MALQLEALYRQRLAQVHNENKHVFDDNLKIIFVNSS